MKRFCTIAVAALFCLPALALGFGNMGNPSLQTTDHTGTVTAPPAQPQMTEPLTGKVAEVINSGGYTYVLLKKKGGEKIWVAFPNADVQAGSQLSFAPGMVMHNFQSKSLKRTFEEIVFSNGPIQPKGAKKNAKKEPLKGKSTGSSTQVSPDLKVRVKKATGRNAYTIAELYRHKAKLDKKKVVVRGKVVKVSANIMGKTWIHLRDGSGGHATGDFDLMVTSKSIPAEGEVVLVRGVLHKDKDFGSGYKYAIIIEDANITVE